MPRHLAAVLVVIAGCARSSPPGLWAGQRNHEVALHNTTDHDICVVTIGFDGPAPDPSAGPVVDYLAGPLVAPGTASLAARLRAHGSGVVRMPIPPSHVALPIYDVAAFGCQEDGSADELIVRWGDVDPHLDRLDTAEGKR